MDKWKEMGQLVLCSFNSVAKKDLVCTRLKNLDMTDAYADFTPILKSGT